MNNYHGPKLTVTEYAVAYEENDKILFWTPPDSNYPWFSHEFDADDVAMALNFKESYKEPVNRYFVVFREIEVQSVHTRS